MIDLALLEARILSLASAAAPGKTIDPTDIARSMVGSDPEAWSAAMIPLRRVAIKLAKEGRLVIYRKGKPTDPDDFKGVYRLGVPRDE